MRTADVECEKEYMAYCGSLARVRVVETGLPWRYHAQSRETKAGVLVEACEDVRLAIDTRQAEREGRPARIVHLKGARFVIPARDIDRLAL